MAITEHGESARSVRDSVSADEWETRVNLAAAFRIAYHLGWNNRLVNHITARVAGEPEHFLMNPHGLGWHEVTASSLVKADFDGNIVSDGAAELAPAGLNFHSAILKAKPDLACVCHTHPTAGVVISATRCGLKILDQTGCQLHGEVAYHAFEGYASDADEAPRIVADLGDRKAMIMWNHGLLTVGRTIAEAFSYMRRLIGACELQERVMAMGTEIREIPEDVLDFTKAQVEARRPNQPLGGPEWQMNLRLADQLYPDYKT
ncbi:MAG: class II aldolase/adducin family protein [Alphaproteobacteria bacterium]|nr:class II aldolase/adducin family protein [Alphaproteobacteria bacterium]